MRKFPGHQVALLNQNSKDIPTPSDRTCYFFGIPMEIKPVTLHAKTRNKLAVYQVFLGGQRVVFFLLLVELLQRKLYGAESLEVNKSEFKGLKRFRSGSNHEGQIRAIF